MNSKQWTGDQRQCLPSKTIANNWIRTKTNVSYRINSPCRCLLCSMNFMGIFSIAWTWEKHNSQIDEPNRTRRIPYNNRSSTNQKQMSHYLLWLFTLAVLCGMYFWYCHCVIATIIIKMWTMDKKREREKAGVKNRPKSDRNKCQNKNINRNKRNRGCWLWCVQYNPNYDSCYNPFCGIKLWVSRIFRFEGDLLMKLRRQMVLQMNNFFSKTI